jgi:hypothetical protein
MMRPALSILFILLASSSWGASPESIVRDGDIIFQTSRSSQSIAIQRATHSPYSHVGLIFLRAGRPYVFEAEATVRFTPLGKWISRGMGGHFVIRRLRHAGRTLDGNAVQKLNAQALRFQGRPYDPIFEWSDDRIYCSELVWKVYDRALGVQLGPLKRLKEFDLSDPIVARKMKERYGADVPMEEQVISPADIFHAKQLVTVIKK